MVSSKRLEGLVALLLALAMVCAGLAIYAGNQSLRHLGPRTLAQAADGSVWVYVDNELLIADQRGTLLKRVSLQEYDLPGVVNSIVRLPDQDGARRMLLAALGSPDWLILDGAGRSLGRLRPTGIAVPVNDTFHLATDDQGRIAMGTAGDHRVLLFDRDGRFLAQSEAGLFRFANGLWFDDDRWWVTDTNHGQVRILDGETLAPQAVVPVPAVSGASYPALGRPGPVPGHLTVGTMFNDMERGRVIEVDGDGRLLQEFQSSAAQPKPTDFLWLGDRLLLADQDDFSLQLFSRDGTHLGRWGDAGIVEPLAAGLESRRHWRLLLRSAQTGALLLGVMAIGLYLWSRQDRGTVEPADPEDSRWSRLGTPWLPPTDLLMQTVMLNWPLWVSGLIMVVVLRVWLSAVPRLLPMPGAGEASLSTVLLLAGVMALPLLAFLAVLHFLGGVMQSRRQRPEFEAILASRAVLKLRKSPKAMSEVRYDEKILEVLGLVTRRLFPAFNQQIWVLTNQRLLVFAETSLGNLPLQAAHPRVGMRARVEPTAGWLGRMAHPLRIVLALPDGRRLKGYPASPITARRFADLAGIKAGRPAVRSGVVTAAPPGSAGLRSRRAFLMSLLFPGLGQFVQGRFVPGLVMLTGMLIILVGLVGPVLMGWIGHFYDVPWSIGVPSLIVPVVWAASSAWDASEFERR